MYVFHMIFATHSDIFSTVQLYVPETQISLCFSTTQRYSLVHISHYTSRSMFWYDHASNLNHNADTLRM